jgi:hypothetical protein
MTIHQSELEQRILAVLDDAGEEDVPTLLNTVLLGAVGAGTLNSYLVALRILVTQNLIRLANSRENNGRLSELSIEESLQEIDNQAVVLKYDPAEGSWQDSSRTGPPYPPSNPNVVRTQLGKQRSREILTERGYQWWSPIP